MIVKIPYVAHRSTTLSLKYIAAKQEIKPQ